jgi:hypothetical protein
MKYPISSVLIGIPRRVAGPGVLFADPCSFFFHPSPFQLHSSIRPLFDLRRFASVVTCLAGGGRLASGNAYGKGTFLTLSLKRNAIAPARRFGSSFASLGTPPHRRLARGAGFLARSAPGGTARSSLCMPPVADWHDPSQARIASSQAPRSMPPAGVNRRTSYSPCAALFGCAWSCARWCAWRHRAEGAAVFVTAVFSWNVVRTCDRAWRVVCFGHHRAPVAVDRQTADVISRAATCGWIDAVFARDGSVENRTQDLTLREAFARVATGRCQSIASVIRFAPVAYG